MSEEEAIRNLIKERIDKYGYNSANFRLALMKEGELWKIIIAKIVLDISNPQGQKTLLNENNFALEDISVSLEEFRQFLDYLKAVYVGNIKFQGSSVNITTDILFKIGSYKLCFVGNFPSRELYFFGRQVSKEYHGIDRPIYQADYAIHDSVTAKAYHKLDLTGHEVPLRNVTEALNYYWGTHYEQHSMYTGSSIYMPIFDASIASCNLEGTCFKLEFDINTSRTKTSELSLAVIAQGKDSEYRKRHELSNSKLEIDLGFKPNYASIFLNKDKVRIDEFNYHSHSLQTPVRIPQVFTRSRSQVREAVGEVEDDTETKTQAEKEPKPLFDQDVITNLPKQIQTLLIEAQNAFNNELYRSVVILLRSILEEGITLVIKQSGKEQHLYEGDFEAGLQKKIRILLDSVPLFRQNKVELDTIKWFGDKATHESTYPIRKSDITDNIEPKFRLFLVKLIEFGIKT